MEDATQTQEPVFPKFTCPKHGEIDSYVMGILGHDSKHHMYCIFCFNEMIAEHCCEAKPIEEGKPE